MLTLSRKKAREVPAPDEDLRPGDHSEEGEVDESADSHKRKGTPDVANSWTHGERLKSKASTALVWGLIACGPLALFGQALGGDSSDQPAAVQAQDAGQSQRVSEFAATFVTRFLSTPRGQEEEVAKMLAQGTESDLSLSADPVAPTAVTPGQAVEVSEGRWMVTVSSEQPAGKDKPSTLRYWQVPVVTSEAGETAAGGLPSMVSAPTAGDLSADSGSRVSDSNVNDTATAFMQAYLAGQGEVAPLTSPDTQLTAVVPTPFTEVSVSSVTSPQEIPSAPAEGDRLRAQISVTATAADGTKTQLEYSLDLRYRDRWEVAAVNPTTPAAPAESEGDQS